MKGKPPKSPARPVVDVAWIAEALNRADVILAAPPAKAHIVRVRPVGQGRLVARFVLPLTLAPTLNAFAELPHYARKKIKTAAAGLMLAQVRFQRGPLLSGRPFVRAVRFSSVEVDRDSGWCKVAIDRLTGKHGGLGYLEDDKPSKLDLHAWWEPAPPKRGFVLVELWTGASAARGAA